MVAFNLSYACMGAAFLQNMGWVFARIAYLTLKAGGPDKYDNVHPRLAVDGM